MNTRLSTADKKDEFAPGNQDVDPRVVQPYRFYSRDDENSGPIQESLEID